jgi:hypothetical protein
VIARKRRSPNKQGHRPGVARYAVCGIVWNKHTNALPAHPQATGATADYRLHDLLGGDATKTKRPALWLPRVCPVALPRV